MRYCQYLLLPALVLLLSGCAGKLTNAEVPDAHESGTPELLAPQIQPEYTIRVVDRLAIRSFYEPELNQEVVVRPDGRISLLLMGDVFVANMTPSNLEETIITAYRRVIESPDVTVIVKQSAGMSVFLGGEVRNPSLQPMDGSLTVVQSITTAGGLLPTANANQVLILRRQADGQFKTFKLDMERVLVNEIPDVYLQPKDVVYVPSTRIANVNKFVDQYINQIIPDVVRVNFTWLNTNSVID